MLDVGTFWKMPDNSWYIMVMSNTNGYMSIIALETWSMEFMYTKVVPSDLINFEPSANFEMNNFLINELGKYE